MTLGFASKSILIRGNVHCVSGKIQVLWAKGIYAIIRKTTDDVAWSIPMERPWEASMSLYTHF